MADALGQPVEDVIKYYRQNNDKLDLFKQTLLEKRGIKLIIDSSEIETVEPETNPGDEEKSD